MSLADRVKKGPARGPVKVVVHGPPGVGKTTFAAGAKDPLFLCSEDGAGLHTFDRVPVTSWGAAMDVLDEVIDGEHNYRTLVIDTVDWLEHLLVDHIITTASEREHRRYLTLEDVGGGYGKGEKAMNETWRRDLLGRLDLVANRRKMHVLLLAHSAAVMVKDPSGADYMQWSIKCGKGIAALLREWSEYVLFADFDRQVDRKGKVKEEAGGLPRRLYTTAQGGYDAKNRLGLPSDMNLSWRAFGDAVTLAWKKAHPTVEEPTATSQPGGTP